MKKQLLRNSIKHRFCFLALMIALFGVLRVDAANYYAIASGNWNINTTWSATSGGSAVAVGLWPVAGDMVYIGEGATARTVTIPAGYAANCTNIFLGNSTPNATAATLTLATSSSSLNVSGNVILYGPNGNASRIITVDGGTMTIAGNLELGNGQTGNQANRICRVTTTNGTVTVNGNLVFTTGTSAAQSVIDMTAGAGTFNLSGSFTINNNYGTLTAGTTSTFNFKGSSAGQTIPIGISLIVYNNININNTSISGAAPSAAITATNVTGNLSVQSGTLNNGGFAITLASTKNFSVANGATFNLTGTSGMVTVSGGGTKTFGPTSTVNYGGTNETVSSETYGHLTFSDGGTKTLPATLSLAGNWTNNAVINTTTNSSTVTFSGASGQQTIGGTNPSTFYNLILNNSNGISLGNNTTIANSLTLTNGTISTGAYELIISNTAISAITGASSSRYINGKLRLAIAGGANTYHFPIGTASVYAPVIMAFNGSTLAGSLTAFTTDGDHPVIISSSFSPTSTVNRYWTFSVVSGLATANYNATFNWVSSDQDGPFNYSTAYVEKYSGGSWTHSIMGALTATSAQINGETGFSDFQVGNGCFSPPSATISGNVITCAGNEVLIRVDLTGSPNWSYTWSDGTNSGTVSNVSSSPSFFAVSPASNTTYTITSVIDAVGCTGTFGGSATVITGPVTIAPTVKWCSGTTVDVPIRVKSFTNVGAISLTMNYLTSVLVYDSYLPNPSPMIDFVQADESGSTGILRMSGIAESVFPVMNDNDVLITLRFTYKGGSTGLIWDDSGDGTKCEYAGGSPDFNPYCDVLFSSYYINGSVSDGTLDADFTISSMTPSTTDLVLLSDITTGGTGREWSFDRPGDVSYISGTYTDPNPQVQFTDGGTHIITLTATNGSCTDVKTVTILVGVPGLWDGPVSEDWNTNTNWDNHVIPASVLDVIIPTRPMIPAVHYYPHITGDLVIGGTINSITLTGTAELHISGALTVNEGKVLNIRDNAKVFANGK